MTMDNTLASMVRRSGRGAPRAAQWGNADCAGSPRGLFLMTLTCDLRWWQGSRVGLAQKHGRWWVPGLRCEPAWSRTRAGEGEELPTVQGGPQQRRRSPPRGGVGAWPPIRGSPWAPGSKSLSATSSQLAAPIPFPTRTVVMTNFCGRLPAT